MDSSTALIIGLIVGLAVGGIVGLLIAAVRRSRYDAAHGQTGSAAESPEVLAARHEAALAELRASEGAARAELQSAEAAMRARLQADLASAQASLESMRERAAQQQEQYRELMDRQRADAAARAEREQAQAQQESKVLQVLAPVKETLAHMQSKVTELEQQRTRQHGELAEQLRSATASEERLRRTAESLASALNSNSTRGVWGETQLRRVVEAAGLIDRVDFDVQSSISSDAGVGRPDMIVHLPGGKAIAVDAKAPFAAYLEASAIPDGADAIDAARRKKLMDDHVKALRGHVTALAGRAYWDGLDASPEFVVAFIPSESLVSAAMQADPSLMEFAFSKRVALASPVTLWSVLKSVAYTWQQEVLTEDAKKLFDLSRELYGRIATMSTHIDKLGRSIGSSVRDYNKFVGSLERQVLPSARKLAALDESKVLPTLSGLEDTPRVLTAAELVDGTAPLALSAALDVPDHVEGLPAAGDDSVNDLAASPDAFGDSVNEFDGSPYLFDGAEVAASGTLHGAR
jgi:DNA recombination protein RmuC